MGAVLILVTKFRVWGLQRTSGVKLSLIMSTKSRAGRFGGNARQGRGQGIGAFFSVQNGSGSSQMPAMGSQSSSQGTGSANAPRKNFFEPRRRGS